MALDILKIRKDFPILEQKVYGKPLIYFDSAASAQKVLPVLKKEEQLVLEYYGNIHRGAHYMADKATADFEAVRDSVKNFINARYREEIIFTKGATEGMNLVAFSFGESFIKEGDEIIITEMEHHANIVPWQMMAMRKKAVIKVIPFSDDGRLEVEKLDSLISDKTKIIAVAQVSNTLGMVNPVKEIIEKAHSRGIKVLVDGAQSVKHFKIDVQDMDADFFSFSSHKMYGPNGVGVLYGKRELLNKMVPYQGGGEMISVVKFEKTTYNDLPYKFEAGTPDITGVIAFGEAVRYLNEMDTDAMVSYENSLTSYCMSELKKIDGVIIYGTYKEHSSVISFNIKGIHHYDLAMILDKGGVALRSGRLCADPVMDHYGVQGMLRVSFDVYNTFSEVDSFIVLLKKAVKMLGGAKI